MQLPTIYNTYNAKSMDRIHFEKLSYRSQVRKRAGQAPPPEFEDEDEDEIRVMKVGEISQTHETETTQTLEY